MPLSCPLCGCKSSKIQRTYPNFPMRINGRRVNTIKRRRVCHRCGEGWYTIERNEDDILVDHPQDF